MILKFKKIILVMSLLSIFSSCEAQTKLPKDLPSNAEIIYISEGGFSPSFFRVEIVGLKMKIKKQSAETQNQEITSEAELSAAEVQNLYKVFVENKFDSLKPNEDMGVADGKSRSIELKFDQNRFYATNGDGVEPPKGHAERFRKIEDAIGKLIAAHSKKEN